MVREDKLLLGCQRYIGESLGVAFMQPQPWTMDSILPDTNPLTPTIFILTSGADPTTMLLVRPHPLPPVELAWCFCERTTSLAIIWLWDQLLCLQTRNKH